MKSHAKRHLPGITWGWAWIGYLCMLTWMLSSVTPTHGQEFRGLITGQVADPSGAVIAEAKITAVREGNTETYTAKTNGRGDYSIPYALPGVYTITAEAPGFRKMVRRGVILDVAQKLNVNFALELGALSDVVTVEAHTATLNTGDASGGSIMDP